MRLTGLPLELEAYPAESLTNFRFAGHDLARLDRFYLPPALAGLWDEPPVETHPFLEDDNRGAVEAQPIATFDGVEFYLSVKGVGSTIDPYSWSRLDRHFAAELAHDSDVRERLRRGAPNGADRVITGELWLRGSPYGGQGLEHATTALRISEMADLTSIGGFRIAPVVKVCFLPAALEERLRQIHWYRQYRGRFVQEMRLVPSNVRIYFHAKHTVGNSVGHVFDLFQIDSDDRAQRFEVNFVRSTIAMLTLFARTMTRDPTGDGYRGLDFHDVWLDKDAVVAPDGSVYFVDLEGIEAVTVPRGGVKEKIEDQVYRSLYELTFAYEQIERERVRRFGAPADRKRHFEQVVRSALRDDPYVGLEDAGANLEFVIRNKGLEESLYTRFQAVDR